MSAIASAASAAQDGTVFLKARWSGAQRVSAVLFFASIVISLLGMCDVTFGMSFEWHVPWVDAATTTALFGASTFATYRKVAEKDEVTIALVNAVPVAAIICVSVLAETATFAFHLASVTTAGFIFVLGATKELRWSLIAIGASLELAIIIYCSTFLIVAKVGFKPILIIIHPFLPLPVGL